ncbi:DUF3348 domain-containing protein [Caballeronia sp. BR00000012568055]|uniref:DUF3348 domain-containing protein n=1 Tax=Caballeronia sp. BR00000012568055 TaxID=2918761 RepID=UPI0023F8D76B
MVQTAPRTAISGPALVRLLARFAAPDQAVAVPASSLSDRLSQWLGWTDAIALSTALAGDPPAVSAAVSAPESEIDAVVNAHDALMRRLTRDERKEVRGRNRRAMPPPPDLPIDYAVFRQDYLSAQQSMETDIGAWRTRLRAAVAAQSTDMTRLAVVDAVMEQALAARERTLLSQVPVLLGKHFERLKRANADAETGTQTQAWLDDFRRDMQHVLLAELEIRYQPVEALLAALRHPSSPR